MANTEYIRVISNPKVKRTLATLRKAEFGFLGVIVEKLTDKSPLLPLYRTVHEIFTSYGSLFNFFWSHWICFLVRFENLSPSSIPFRRVTRTNSVTFLCSNWTLSFLLFSKKKIFSFFLPNICGSNHDLLIRTRNLSRSILLPHSSIIRKILFNQVFIFFVVVLMKRMSSSWHKSD